VVNPASRVSKGGGTAAAAADEPVPEPPVWRLDSSEKELHLPHKGAEIDWCGRQPSCHRPTAAAPRATPAQPAVHAGIRCG
jgi:hypothetical protein